MADPWREITCYKCKEPFFVSRETYQVLLRSHQSFYCPFGHSQHFLEGPSEADKLRDQLASERRARQSAEQKVEFHSQMQRRAERSAVAYKGQATKLRKRAKVGACPCCNRTFVHLERHMATKHPEFDVNPDSALPAGVPPVLASGDDKIVELDMARRRPKRKATV